MRIDRCTCFRQSFAALKAAADEHGIRTPEALRQVVPFGLRCGLCLPYVRRALRTGETVFHDIITEADEPPTPGTTT